jgi:hypothetical protein
MPEPTPEYLIQESRLNFIFQPLLYIRREDIFVAIKDAFSQGNYDALFTQLDTVLELTDLDNPYLVVMPILSLLNEVALSDGKKSIDEYQSKIRKEIHPSRSARVSDTLSSKWPSDLAQGMARAVQQKQLTQSQGKSVSNPIISDGSSSDPSRYVYGDLAMYLSLNTHNGEPIFMVRPDQNNALYEYDGLNGEVYRILKPGEPAPEDYKDKPIKVKRQQDVQQLRTFLEVNPLYPRSPLLLQKMAEQLIGKPSGLALFVDRAMPHVSGTGTETDPYTSKDLAPEPLVMVAMLKSAQHETPVYLLTGGVLQQVDAQYRTARYIAGSPLDSHRTREDIMATIDRVNKLIDKEMAANKQ